MGSLTARVDGRIIFPMDLPTLLTRLECVRPHPEDPDVKEVRLFVDKTGNRIGIGDPNGHDALVFQVPLSDVLTLLKQEVL